MSTVIVRVFGQFEVRRGGQVLAELGQTKAQELFAYLLLHQKGPLSRESVAACLWQDAGTVPSLKYLRHALWQLKTALSSTGRGNEAPLLLTSPKWIYLNPSAGLRADVLEFDQAFDLVRRVRSSALDAPAIQAVEKALRLYRGELLQGWTQEWCLAPRFGFEDKYLHIASKLMDYYSARGEHDAAIALGARALQIDPAQEGLHLRLMHLYDSAGDRIAALRQYERCVQALKAELDVEPSEPTTALYQQIRSCEKLDSLENTVSGFEQSQSTQPPGDGKDSAGQFKGSPGTVSTLAALLARLESLQKELAALQASVQENIKAVQTALNEQKKQTLRRGGAR